MLKSHAADDIVETIATIFHRCVYLLHSNTNQFQTNEINFDGLIYECSRLLRNSCANGHSVQNRIAQFVCESHLIFDSINQVLVSKKLCHKARKMCWQFVANLGVQNETTQHQIWIKSIDPMLYHLNCVCETETSRECTMILYNLCISEILNMADVKKIVELLLQCIVDQSNHHELQTNDFHQLSMEYIITKYRSIVPVYDRLSSTEKRLHLIYYIADHMKGARHESISTVLLQFICKEFKKKSDCILRVNKTTFDAMHAKEVIALLDVIAQASSDERYSHVLATDNSLFINIGCLLQSIHEIGKQSNVKTVGDEIASNIFTPVQELNQIAPNSSDETSIERDISYQLKSMLIRILGNLAYKNKENQNLVSGSNFAINILLNISLQKTIYLIVYFSVYSLPSVFQNKLKHICNIHLHYVEIQNKFI